MIRLFRWSNLLMGLRWTSLLAAVTVARPGLAVGTLPVRLVAVTGAPAPETNDSVTFASFSPPLVDDSGRAAFFGYLTEGDDGGVFAERAGGTLQLVARNGNPPPVGPSPYVFSGIGEDGEILMSATGGIVFRGDFKNPNGFVPTSGIWVSVPGQALRLVALVNAVPGITAPVLGNLRFSDINRQNEIGLTAGFGAQVARADVDGAIQQLAKVGDLAPGTSIAFDGVLSPQLNNSGQATFRGHLLNNRNDGIWKWLAPGDLRLVMLEGTPTPDLPGINFSNASLYSIDDAGRAAFSATLSGGGAARRFGIWSERADGSLQRVFAENDLAPGFGPDVRFAGGVSSTPSFASSGDLAFLSALAGPGIDSSNDTSVWAASAAGQLRLVVQEGDAAPGAEPGVQFAEITRQFVNRLGKVAIFAFLRGPGVDPNTNDRGIWAEDINGKLRLIGRRGGTVVDGTAGQFLLSGLEFVDEGWGDNGHVAFRGFLPGNRTGVFVSNTVAVPEPGSLVLLGTAVVMMVLRRALSDQSRISPASRW